MNLRNRKVPKVITLVILQYLSKAINGANVRTISQKTWNSSKMSPYQTDYILTELVQEGFVSNQESKEETQYQITDAGKCILKLCKSANRALGKVEKVYKGSA
ncbi:DUF4364 family protein [Patescibacteria group bacterium]|nr:DUF4364 family protein [Patescibacteria group bacterium]